MLFWIQHLQFSKSENKQVRIKENQYHTHYIVMGFVEEEKMKEIFDGQVGEGICQTQAGETHSTQGGEKREGGQLEEN